ncbi:hypothetical protein [Chitinophaga sancti]|uniref:Uncharacterized protein n=1 Tax=Chitinophaga sancti TaxID=1004 RepID=A0A1K1MGN7_9BACT|nr:hypothetical protein [Chitinophaga sancti]WQD62670.1 hypothetical protein U0033_32770 [Chitinophaga sancti]WQG91706.1 hypothetical protein SR876_09335 [Chitinophaga sancti]SFW22267.1 hypothetical protein SAMN05661012_00557 [Chitinophaga sancti]
MSDQRIILNIITPCTRPENLQRIGESIRYSQQFAQDVHIKWHIHVDRSVHHIVHNHCDVEFREKDGVHFIKSNMTGIAGHVHRNSFLIQNEWRGRIDGPQVMDEWIMSLEAISLFWVHKQKITIPAITAIVKAINPKIRHICLNERLGAFII